jgi:hypothetical protein
MADGVGYELGALAGQSDRQIRIDDDSSNLVRGMLIAAILSIGLFWLPLLVGIAYL